MAEELYTWVPFYTELANKLLPYKNDRAALIDKLQAMYESIDTKLPKLDDGGVPNDIDPFTIFGLFNKGISSQNRRKIVAALADVFCITAELPNALAQQLECHLLRFHWGQQARRIRYRQSLGFVRSGTCSS